MRCGFDSRPLPPRYERRTVTVARASSNRLYFPYETSRKKGVKLDVSPEGQYNFTMSKKVMADPKEKLSTLRFPEDEGGGERQSPSSPDRKLDLDRGAAKIVEGIDEDGETAEGLKMGDVSEETTEDKKRASGSGVAATKSDDEIAAIRAKLLANLPTEKVMVRQIKAKLIKDEKRLNKEYSKAMRLGQKAAFRLVQVVAQLRKINDYLAMLANATFDVVKQLWLKIVHGV